MTITAEDLTKGRHIATDPSGYRYEFIAWTPTHVRIDVWSPDHRFLSKEFHHVERAVPMANAWGAVRTR